MACWDGLDFTDSLDDESSDGMFEATAHLHAERPVTTPCSPNPTTTTSPMAMPRPSSRGAALHTDAPATTPSKRRKLVVAAAKLMLTDDDDADDEEDTSSPPLAQRKPSRACSRVPVVRFAAEQARATLERRGVKVALTGVRKIRVGSQYQAILPSLPLSIGSLPTGPMPRMPAPVPKAQPRLQHVLSSESTICSSSATPSPRPDHEDILNAFDFAESWVPSGSSISRGAFAVVGAAAGSSTHKRPPGAAPKGSNGLRMTWSTTIGKWQESLYLPSAYSLPAADSNADSRMTLDRPQRFINQRLDDAGECKEEPTLIQSGEVCRMLAVSAACRVLGDRHAYELDSEDELELQRAWKAAAAFSITSSMPKEARRVESYSIVDEDESEESDEHESDALQVTLKAELDVGEESDVESDVPSTEPSTDLPSRERVDNAVDSVAESTCGSQCGSVLLASPMSTGLHTCHGLASHPLHYPLQVPFHSELPLDPSLDPTARKVAAVSAAAARAVAKSTAAMYTVLAAKTVAKTVTKTVDKGVQTEVPLSLSPSPEPLEPRYDEDHRYQASQVLGRIEAALSGLVGKRLSSLAQQLEEIEKMTLPSILTRAWPTVDSVSEEPAYSVHGPRLSS